MRNIFLTDIDLMRLGLISYGSARSKKRYIPISYQSLRKYLIEYRGMAEDERIGISTSSKGYCEQFFSSRMIVFDRKKEEFLFFSPESCSTPDPHSPRGISSCRSTPNLSSVPLSDSISSSIRSFSASPESIHSECSSPRRVGRSSISSTLSSSDTASEVIVDDDGGSRVSLLLPSGVVKNIFVC
eukprot:gnl/Carplike_NY0171/530_a728_2009.p1 GENE.gnl/Carplike_NY0171/530_a728_2009~~gnl/Carplike_NY0171/530_a728_2009.p1  ORF type:complete len:185 (+),score=33.00 gnl/Carplike_NY0171/530_a728_2009:125-679(+)